MAYSLKKLTENIIGLQQLNTIALEGIQIQEIKTTSTQVQPGDLFICQTGLTTDGHRYIPEAIARGARAIVLQNPDYLPQSAPIPFFLAENTAKMTAILASRFYNDPSSQMLMIGVTGSDGKTTTSHLIERILNTNGQKACLDGTMNFNSSHSRYTFLSCMLELKFRSLLSKLKSGCWSSQWSRQAVATQKQLAFGVEKGFEAFVLEVTSHAIEQDRVYECDFDVAVFTNLSYTHIDYHGSMERYAETKSRLFSGLRSDGRKPALAIINLDDAYASTMQKVCAPQTRIVTYGLATPEADVTAYNLNYTLHGTTFACKTPAGVFQLKTPLQGQFGVYNTLAATATAIALGIPPQHIQKAVQTFQPVAGRYQLLSSKNPITIVDFAHTPNGMEQVLSTTRHSLTPLGKLVSVHGYSPKTPDSLALAQCIARYADVMILTELHPGRESKDEVKPVLDKLAAELAGAFSGQIKIEPNRAKAIEYGITHAGIDDAVIITGKGAEKYARQSKFPWPSQSDGTVAQSILDKRHF